MSCYLYGFIESQEEKTFGPIGFAVGNAGKGSIISLPDTHLAAVVGPSPNGNFSVSSKENLVRWLLSHQETLEIIMRTQFILPCKFGTILKDHNEAREILSQSRARLEQWFHTMENCCEMDVIATWDMKRTLQEIVSQDPAMGLLKNELEMLPSADQETARIAVGARLSIKLKEEAMRYEMEISTKLAAAGEKVVTHALMNDEMVFNASFLLARRAEEGFVKLLETLDRDFENRLNFKCVGPLPPYSFATVTVQRFETEKIERAKEMLGLKDVASLDQIRKSYAERARQCHPDVNPHVDLEKFETLNQAYTLLTSYHEGGVRSVAVSLCTVNGERP